MNLIRYLAPFALAPLLVGCTLVTRVGAGGGVNFSSGSRASSGGIEGENSLTERWCATLEERLAEPAARLAAAKSESDPRRALAIHGQVRRDAETIQYQVQEEFNAEYERNGKAVMKANLGGIGYNSTNNGNNFQISVVGLRAVAGGTQIMAKNGLPFASDNEHGIRAQQVQFASDSACKSDERRSLWRQINENQKEDVRPFDIHSWGREDDMPVKAGDLVSVEGGLVSAGANPTIKLAGGRPIYNNCRTTNRFSHFDSNGNARYEEECQYAGGRELVTLTTVKDIRPFLPAEASELKVGDRLKLTARLVSVSKKVTKKGTLTTTTHTVELTPVVVEQVARDRKALYTF